jgi:hypothetical protein
MQSFAHFSQHAFIRIAQRTALSCEEIAEILDQKRCISVGKAPGFNREHWLFYSIKDQCCFVAIQDTMSGTVITILPMDYHKTLAWEINSTDCEQAKKLAKPYLTVHTEKQTAAIFSIRGHYLDETAAQKTKTLLKVPCATYQNDMKRLLADEHLFENLAEIAVEKGIQPDHMFSISIQQGSKRTPFYIDLRSVDHNHINEIRQSMPSSEPGHSQLVGTTNADRLPS